MTSSSFHLSIRGRRPDINVKGMGTIEVGIGSRARNVSISQRKSLIRNQLESALCVFSQAIQGGPV